jgi:hypothetical protein
MGVTSKYELEERHLTQINTGVTDNPSSGKPDIYDSGWIEPFNSGSTIPAPRRDDGESG